MVREALPAVEWTNALLDRESVRADGPRGASSPGFPTAGDIERSHAIIVFALGNEGNVSLSEARQVLLDASLAGSSEARLSRKTPHTGAH